MGLNFKNAKKNPGQQTVGPDSLQSFITSTPGLLLNVSRIINQFIIPKNFSP